MIKGEFVGRRGGYFWGDGIVVVFKIDFTWEFDFKREVEDGDRVDIDFDFFLNWHINLIEYWINNNKTLSVSSNDQLNSSYNRKWFDIWLYCFYLFRIREKSLGL